MKKEWVKKFKVLKKANKNKDQTVSMIHAMQIIKRFIRKRKERKLREAMELNPAFAKQ